MNPSTFINLRCSLCGTQSCYGTTEDLPYCSIWKKVKDYPDELAKVAIDYYDNKPRTKLEILNEFIKRY